ncbi:MAG: PAS domain S-box protein [Oligoflexia bacterium]|nr:PAS domain S-box protein [Oligoflexia bacterium]
MPRIDDRRLIAAIERITPVLIIVISTEGRIVHFSPGCEQASGYRAEEAMGRLFWELLVPPEEVAAMRAEFERLVAENLEKHEYEGTLQGKDGSRKWIVWHGAVVSGLNGDSSERFVVGTGIDRTARKEIERDLRSSRERYAELMNSVDGIVWEADATSFCFHYVSSQAERILGYPVERWLREPNFWANHIYPPDRDKTVDYCLNATRALKSHQFEYRMVAANGRTIWLRDLVTVVAKDGKPEVLRGIMIDISERKKLEEERQHLLEEAHEAVALRNDFLSIASHELRTPITPLRLQISAILRLIRSESLAEVPREHLLRLSEIAERQLSRLTRLVDNLLDVSRITSGRLKLAYEEVDLASLVREVVERFQPEIDASQVRVEFHANAHPVGCWDHLRIEQIVVNLLTNALKYGAGRPVHITVDEQEGQALLTVTDEGIGIPMEQQKKIFDRFGRAVSSRQFAGMGLGLFIISQIVQAHQGKVEVKSEPGKGATFIVKLPKAMENREMVAA